MERGEEEEQQRGRSQEEREKREGGVRGEKGRVRGVVWRREKQGKKNKERGTCYSKVQSKTVQYHIVGMYAEEYLVKFSTAFTVAGLAGGFAKFG